MIRIARLFRSIRNVVNLFRARRLGVLAEKSAYISFWGKIDVDPNARVFFSDHVSIFHNYRIEACENASITIGEGVHFREGARLYAGRNAQLSIGAGCYFNHDVSLVAVRDITIGDNSVFGPYCYIIDNDHGTEKTTPIMQQPQEAEPIHIGTEVWLGVGATVLMGVTVGNGAVVAARAVVTKSVPSEEIWAGIPARRIGAKSER